MGHGRPLPRIGAAGHSVSRAPRIVTGSKVVTKSGSNWIPLWSYAEFRAEFGVDYSDSIFIGAYNGDARQVGSDMQMTVRHVPGERIDVVVSDKPSNFSRARIDWIVVIPG